MPTVYNKRGTKYDLSMLNPVLGSGELCLETDTNRIKFGDGVSGWNSLQYAIFPSGASNGQFLQYNATSGTWIPSSSGNFSILQVNGSGVALSEHTHTSSSITDFNSSVSGLLPTIANSGDNRILTSTGTSVGINAEGNLTFDGSLLNVNGSGNFNSIFVSGVSLGEVIDDEVAGLLIAGSGITLNYNDVINSLTIDTNTTTSLVAGSGISLTYNSGTDELSISTNLSTTNISNFNSAVSGLMSKTIAFFAPMDNMPPATNYATLDTRNSILVLEFDATTQESAVFVGVIPDNAILTNGLIVRLFWMADTATSGDVRWGISFEKTGTDNDTDSFSTVTQANGTANGTSGIETITSITATDIDSLVAGDRYRLRITRIADDATNDTMTGDAQLVAVELRVT